MEGYLKTTIKIPNKPHIVNGEEKHLFFILSGNEGINIEQVRNLKEILEKILILNEKK